MTRVLLVDDEENLRLALRTHLRKQGYEVSAVGSVDAALAELERDPVDFLVTDVKMPGRSGLELLTTTRQRWPATVVVVMSAYGSHEDALAAIKGGAQDYLTKPFAPGDLAFTIRKAEEREALKRENKELRAQLARDHQFDALVARSDVMKQLFATISRVAAFKTTVLIQGETGVGKELVARAIHNRSPRRTKPFLAVNCGAIPGNLIESELFGHRKGAFTDAHADKRGIFEEADGGTLFLDEVNSTSLSLQSKLLRALQEGEIRPVGGTTAKHVDVRIVAATNRNLEELVEKGLFREDLFYRLKVFPLRLPPLRERRDDISLLASHFLARYSQEIGKPAGGFSQQALELLTSYEWPGNVRELQNEIQRLVIQLDEGAFVTPELLSPQIKKALGVVAKASVAKGTLREMMDSVEKYLLLETLRDHGQNKTAAAKSLGITREGLHKKLRQHGM